GSVHSTVADMAKFVAEQLAPEPRLLARSTVEEMQRIHWLNPDWREGRGIAWGIHRTDHGTRIEHGGGVYGFTCKILVSPAERLRFVSDAEGRVQRVWVGPHPYDPIDRSD